RRLERNVVGAPGVPKELQEEGERHLTHAVGGELALQVLGQHRQEAASDRRKALDPAVVAKHPAVVAKRLGVVLEGDAHRQYRSVKQQRLGLQLVPGAKQRALLKRGTGVTLKQHFVLGVGTHTCGVERTFGQRDELLQPIKLTGKEIRIGSKDGERN